MTNGSDQAQVSGDDALLHEISLMREKNHFARITAEQTAKETALRLECLKLAIKMENDPVAAIEFAKQFHDFVSKGEYPQPQMKQPAASYLMKPF